MLLQIIISLVVWLAVVYVAFYLTEVKPLPQWLRFPPFSCRICMTFWTNLATIMTIGLAFSLWYFLAAGLILTVLTAISMKVDQKQKTVKVDDVYGEDIEIINDGDEIKVRKV